MIISHATSHKHFFFTRVTIDFTTRAEKTPCNCYLGLYCQYGVKCVSMEEKETSEIEDSFPFLVEKVGVAGKISDVRPQGPKFNLRSSEIWTFSPKLA